MNRCIIVCILLGLAVSAAAQAPELEAVTMRLRKTVGELEAIRNNYAAQLPATPPQSPYNGCIELTLRDVFGGHDLIAQAVLREGVFIEARA